jgi:DNA polymerase-3 subunit gamma/tau
VLTGIRGTGKTTTARIVAKGLNCIGPDGTGGPTTEPCGVCEPCRAISEGRHVDVLEMDAASRTGVGDIREIIDSVAYRAASARFKIYIIDEVHMLSNNAFNALLKTLEEPPAHVKFLFATTEIRKVPVTVLSRCQRFDLRRIEPEVMIAHLARVAGLEGAEVAPDALALIARAAEGSVRDAMSLLDQAISHGAGATTVETVRAMLGLADRGRVLDLFEAVLRGDAAGALAELAAQYADGAEPSAVLRDLAEVTHWVSLVKVTPQAAEDPTVGPDERRRGVELAGRLSLRVLARQWQMLLKALDEVAAAPNAMMAAEMALIRLTHAADLPPPDELIRRLQGVGPSAAPAPRAPSGGNGGARMAAGGGVAPALGAFPDFDAVVRLIREKRDQVLLAEVEEDLRLVRYAPGRIEFQPTDAAAPDLAQRLAQRLQGWTGVRWVVSVAASGGGATIGQSRAAAAESREARALALPAVQAVLAAFPGARVVAVRDPAPEVAATPAPEALPAVDDDWDPFDDL